MVIKLRRTSAFTDQESDAFMVELIEKTVRKSSHPAVSHNPSNRLPAPIGVQAAPRSTSRGGGSGNSSACLTHHGWGLGEAQRESPLTEARRRKSGGGADLRPCVEPAPPRVKQGLQGRGVARSPRPSFTPQYWTHQFRFLHCSTENIGVKSMSNMHINTKKCIHLYCNQNDLEIPILTNIRAGPGI